MKRFLSALLLVASAGCTDDPSEPAKVVFKGWSLSEDAKCFVGTFKNEGETTARDVFALIDTCQEEIAETLEPDAQATILADTCWTPCNNSVEVCGKPPKVGGIYWE